MPKISVIVPVYNVEKYLNRCVDSILSQTFTEFELILIDDGSPDNSGKICDEYKEKDSRVVVIHRENGGVSAARNDGIKIAKGEYIVFIDSDDYVKEKYLEELLHENVDLVCQSGLFIDENNKIIKELYFFDNAKYFDKITDNVVEHLVFNNVLNNVCFKLFKMNIIVNNNICFDSDKNLGEDTLFAIKYAMCTESILVENTENYCYVVYSSRKTLSNEYIVNEIKRIKSLSVDIGKLIYPNNKEKREYVTAYRMKDLYNVMFCDNFSFLLLSDFKKNIKFLLKMINDDDFINCLRYDGLIKIDEKVRKSLLSKNKLNIVMTYTYLQIKKCIDEKLHR